MKKNLVLLLPVLLSFFRVMGQADSAFEDSADEPMPPVELAAPAIPANPEYRLRPALDFPVTGTGVAWSLYAFTRIYGKDPSTEEQILALDRQKLNFMDRWAAGKHSENADKASNYLFYGSIPLPALLLIDREIRKDAHKVGFLYLEAMAITGTLYTGCDYFIDRYRPETYADDLPMYQRVDGNAKNSFFAGHVALVATTTFFTARVYADYHPHSPWRWVLYGGAAAATGTTIYLRHIAGKHFPTDIAVGTAIGVLSGMLVPALHRNRKPGDRGWGISPYVDPLKGEGMGLTLSCRF